MDFTLPPDIESLRRRTRDFIRGEVLPLEARSDVYDEFENIRLDRLDELRAKAKAAGLWAPQMPKERGGLGLPVIGWAALYEEANHSIFGPAALNCAAPDDGNMSVLNKVLATDAQKDKWLQPIVDGKVRSSFAMTEPAPGSGSDPGGMMLTRAEKKNDRYVISGRKWFISGAAAARHFILIARTSDDARHGLSAFLYHGDDPGWRIVRRIDIMGPQEHGGVCELELDGLEIPAENRLLEDGDGLKFTQLRLGPARLTHCMRWLGLAKRCLEIAQAHVAERQAFGTKLAERESVQMMLGDVAKDIEVGRLLTMKAAWALDKGDKAQSAISMAKIHAADTLHKAADTGIQLLGAKGYSKDTVLDWIYRYARAARLIDGASEVHRMLIARALGKEGIDFWKWS
ncbi:acyl-CoA dehydrogenase family protein [Aestuariivirga sp. YIM B02566]|uniref:Acyl-CoA dehydrogenase family protein n=1 Tax=Taklimakanibacter albus TaxID=2800327 RepID=A0ACC5R5X3_9HYPH|nr:acyl-CoA dehydrogenase family protein [Aestuariivirga sp. YIM B02566]MBK1868015.1 acyl-CoA dehydrogenase family protein [Aestuariivirga sp. YIM B02566]